MKESFWGVMILVFGVVSIIIVFFFQSMTNTDEHNYTLLKEATEGAMVDAIDLAYYRRYGKVRIDQEKFVENFVRRFAQSAQLSRTYEIKIYDVNEEPPKVSLSVASKEGTNVTGELLEFDITNRLDAILETPRDCKIDSIVEPDPGYQLIVPGDLDGSGELTAKDVTVLTRYLSGSLTLTAQQRKAADFNNDGKIDQNDLATLRQYLAGGY